jgi:hypothetical protein
VPSVDTGWQASAQLRRVGWLLHANQVEVKLRALERAVKTNFDPNQPRIPAGHPDGGQWTDAGGGGGTQVAQNDPPDRLSDIPKERPPTIRERNRVIKRIAKLAAGLATRMGGGRIGLILAGLEVAEWVYEEYQAYARIAAYADPPKTLEELQQAVSSPTAGYQIHHIVEQTPAEKEGFPLSRVHAPDNLVRIPTLKHEDINGWFGRPAEEFDWLAPRDYLRGKDWAERRRIGIRALIEHEVLKP